MAPPTRPRSERMWPKIHITSYCWEWIGAKTGSRYGALETAGRLELAHRVVYEELVGPIPAGYELDHLCMNRGCVNPAHLEPVTRWENNRRANIALNRGAARTECPYGHPYDEVNTAFRNGRRHCRACARDRQRRNYARKKAGSA